MEFDRDFGINQVFVEDQYERWRNNPAAVSPEWQQYFARLHGLPTVPPFQASAWSQPAVTPGGDGDGNGQLAFSAPPHLGFDIVSIPEVQDRLHAEILQEKVAELINAYRIRGHLFANLDPLGLLQPPPPELEMEHFGLSEEDLDKTFATGDFAVGTGEMTLREILARLQRTYCRTIGVEYMHGEDPAIKRWLQERMEAAENTPLLSREQKLRILARLTDAETLETFLHRKYIGKKRFSLEGAESLIPLLDRLVEEYEAAVILITHNLGIVSEFCDSVAVMYAGRFVETAASDHIFKAPTHPYSEALLRCVPNPEKLAEGPLPAIPGFPPNLAELPGGCSFAPRCPLGRDIERCHAEAPAAHKVTGPEGPAVVECHFAEQRIAEVTEP